jgi:hypothetical protein
MGPAELIWRYGESDAIALGKTLGGIKLSMETHAADIHEDQAGDAAVDAVLTGSELTLELTLTRLSAEQLAVALNTEVDTDGGGNKIVPIENQVGCSLYSLADPIVIKPLCGNVVSTDTQTWVHIYKAYPLAGLEFIWDKDTQRTIPLKFKVFLSQDSGFVGKWGTIGVSSSASDGGL